MAVALCYCKLQALCRLSQGKSLVSKNKLKSYTIKRGLVEVKQWQISLFQHKLVLMRLNLHYGKTWDTALYLWFHSVFKCSFLIWTNCFCWKGISCHTSEKKWSLPSCNFFSSIQSYLYCCCDLGLYKYNWIELNWIRLNQEHQNCHKILAQE